MYLKVNMCPKLQEISQIKKMSILSLLEILKKKKKKSLLENDQTKTIFEQQRKNIRNNDNTSVGG